MAQSQTTGKLTTTTVEDTANPATGFLDVNLGPASTVYYVEIDNTGEGEASYTKFWNSKAPTIGTTAPVMILPSGWSAMSRVVFAGGLGTVFSTGMSYATVKEAGTAGTTPMDVLPGVRVVIP